jgi:iron complex outermembrane receptor protein
MKSTFRFRLMASSLLGATMLSPAAFAQEGAQEPAGETVVVTGSRIARPEAESPVPVAVVDERDLAVEGSQNVSDILNELPQVGIGSTRTNTNFLTSGTGIATVNLRSLGNSRTLTLVNGRRFISGFAGDSAVDLNNIPTDFLERVDIVTGGSSAVYGSDAMAGVVNFVLRDNFKGFTLRAQAGITDEGDNGQYLISATAGTTFGARGNIMANFTYDRDDGLYSRKRDISDQDCSALTCGPAAYSSYAPQGQYQLVSAGGAARPILTGGRSTFSFNPDNSLAIIPGLGAVGYGFNRNAERYISVPVERYLGAVVGNYEISDSVTAFAEVTYSRVSSNSSLEPFALDLLNDIYFRDIDPYGIPITNPFIPGPIAAAIAAANSDADPTNDVAAINGRRRQNDVFDRSNEVLRNTWRVAAGFKGDLGGFNWEASYVYGHMNDFNASQDIDNNRYRNALDAIRVGPGNVVGVDIICRDAAARAEGCIPLNLFGFNTADPRAASYVQAVVPKSEEVTNEQHVAAFSIAGPVATLWAGDLSVAAGVEYRSESTFDDLDILTNTGGNSGNVTPDLAGRFDVWEVYGEARLPLLADQPLAHYLGVNGAVRYSDYSTIGSTFSWNAGLEYEPIAGLRFRGNYAVANRAPNISELFSAPSETFAAVTDPCDGVTATTAGAAATACRSVPAIAAFLAANPGGAFTYTLADLQGINGFVGGNPNLQEEKAKTYTIGLAVSPQLVRGLVFTVDYYNIKIDDAIGSLGRSYSIEQCLLTNEPVYCNNVVRNATTGFVTRVDGQLINVVGYQTSGIDVGVRYSTPLGLLNNDRLSLSGNYTYLIEYNQQSDPANDPIDYSGTFGAGYSRHRANVRATYSIDEFSMSWATRFMSGGPYTLGFTSNNPAVAALNDIKDYWLHDAQIRWDIDRSYSFFLNVDNVFDTKPQYLPGAQFGTPTGLETSADFDVIGRRFTAGAKIRF